MRLWCKKKTGSSLKVLEKSVVFGKSESSVAQFCPKNPETAALGKAYRSQLSPESLRAVLRPQALQLVWPYTPKMDKFQVFHI